MGRLEVESGKSIYYEHYKGSGRPVLFVHGWGMASRVWDTNLSVVLEAGHEAVVFDQRCCGQSDKDFDVVTVKSNAEDVVKLVKGAGLKSPIIVGWSFGCAVTVEAAAMLGGDVGGIVLAGPPTPRFTQTDDFPHGGTAEDVAGTIAALRDTRIELLSAIAQGTCHEPPGDAAVAWMLDMFLQTSPRADAGLADLGTIDHRELLPTIQAPGLVCKGTHDAIVDPAIADICADLLPNGTLLTFENSGHTPFFEEREKFNAALLAFAATPS